MADTHGTKLKELIGSELAEVEQEGMDAAAQLEEKMGEMGGQCDDMTDESAISAIKSAASLLVQQNVLSSSDVEIDIAEAAAVAANAAAAETAAAEAEVENSGDAFDHMDNFLQMNCIQASPIGSSATAALSGSAIAAGTRSGGASSSGSKKQRIMTFEDDD